MELALVLDWTREALRMALLLGGPPLLAALLVGVIVGIGQTLTQMHEPVVGLIPRLIAVLLVVLAILPWLLSCWITYASDLIRAIPERLFPG
jgi:flagellar biosynthesis protein FliQ